MPAPNNGAPGTPPNFAAPQPSRNLETFVVESFETFSLAQIFDVQVGTTASLDTTHARTGSQAVKIHQTGTANASIRSINSLPIVVGRFAFWIASNPSATLQQGQCLGGVNAVFQISTAGIQTAGFTGATVASGITVTDGAWHVIDFRVDLRGSTYLMDWMVDGVAQTQATIAAAGARVVSQFKFASSGAVTIDYWLDDWQLSDDWGSYPLADPPNPRPLTQRLVQVLDQAPFFIASRYGSQRRGLILEPAVQLAAASAPAAPTVTPLPKQTVIQASTRGTLQNRTRNSNVYIGRTSADDVVVTPRPIGVVGRPTLLRVRRWSHVIAPPVQLAAASVPAAPTVTPPRPIIIQAGQPRQRRHAASVQNRWPGYQWVGLPPISPLPKQVVQDQAALETARLERRRGAIIAPPVQLSAASGSTPPPFTGPFPRPVVITMRPATPRQARSGHIIQARTLTAPTAPPRPTIVDLCPATTTRRQRGGHVIVGRPVALPGIRPRPSVIQRATTRRQRRGGVWVEGPQMAVFGSAAPPPSTLITTPLTGYVSVGDSGIVAGGDTGRPGAGDTGFVKTGDTGFPHI
jgi:hypothetical protein